MIIRLENWTKRNRLHKLGGYTAAIVYEQKIILGQPPACNQRLRVKQWAYQRWGRPAQLKNDELINAQSEWFMGCIKDKEYTIAFRDKKLRDWATLL